MSTRKIFKNFNLFLDGTGYMGKVEEVTLPALTWKMEEFQGGGMLAPISTKIGLEKLSSSFVIKSFEHDIIKSFGGPSNKAIGLTVRGSVEDASSTLAVRAEMRGIVSSIETSSLKAGEAPTLTCNMELSYIKLIENGNNIYEIDILNHVFIMNGVDHLSRERQALGI